MAARAMVYLHAASPLHVGTGQSLDAVIDLPIQRERGTNLPVVGGSALKGVMRAECEAPPADELFNVSAFGNEKDPSAGAGAVTFGDARLLLFPVRSVRLLFSWATCPYILRRFVRDRVSCGLDVLAEEAAIAAVATAITGTASTPQAACASSALLLDTKTERGTTTGTAYVEDADLTVRVVPELQALAEALKRRCLPESMQPLLDERLLVVDDTMFGTFARQCTEIIARVKLNDKKKTVERGGLWYEEALPAESVLYAGVLTEPTRGGGKAFSADQHIAGLKRLTSAQFGGKASVGRGLCHLEWELRA